MGWERRVNEMRKIRLAPRNGLIAAIDVGSTKVCCFIARLGEDGRARVTGIGHLLSTVDLEDRTTLTDPRHYNIRWLELLNEVKPRIERFGSLL